MSSSIAIEDYNPKWEAYFWSIENYLRSNPFLKNARIEHVGSTSVRGLCAKPIIDIDIVVTCEKECKKYITSLSSLGYKHRGDLGIKHREAFYNPSNIALPEHHLYVCLMNSLAFKNHLIVREALKNDKELRYEYSKLKKDLAIRFNDNIDKYCEAKTEFIINILKKYKINKKNLDIIRDQNKL